MTRIYVYASNADHKPVGHFAEDRATYWHGDKDFYHDVNTLDQGRGQGLYRTAQGRWVLRRWSNWQGEADAHEYLDPDAARDWLIFNSYDDAVRQHFGVVVEEERGPGRPEVGNRVDLRLGDLKDAVDAYANTHGLSRADAVRTLVAAGLASKAEASR